jgi:probable O-glycosylation ligase (exosortase A-associated)
VRDLLVFGFVLLYIPLALTNVFAAFLLWSWAGLIAIHSYLYGFMMGIPLSQIFAMITLGLLLVPANRGKVAYGGGWVAKVMIVMLIHGLLSALFAYPGLPHNWLIYSNMVKIILLCLLMPLFLYDRRRINIFVMLLAMGVCFHGFIDGLKFISSAGNHNAAGIQKFGDNNHYAAMLLMSMPLLIYIYRFAKSWITRWGTLVSFIITFLAVLATNSRGALISVVAMGGWIILISKRRVAGLLMAATLGLLVTQLASEKWFNRMDTIKSADEDKSFMGRVTAWKRASAIALESPLLGGGYHAGQAPSIYEYFRYKQGLLGFVETPDTGYPAASHSIYFEVLGDLGFGGLILFLMLMMGSFYNWRRIRALAARDPTNLGWAAELSNMLSASMVVYLIGGAALSIGYYELAYYIVMLQQVVWHAIKHPQQFDRASIQGP